MLDDQPGKTQFLLRLSVARCTLESHMSVSILCQMFRLYLGYQTQLDGLTKAETNVHAKKHKATRVAFITILPILARDHWSFAVSAYSTRTEELALE